MPKIKQLWKMKEMRLTNKVIRAFTGSSRGFSLIEVIIALAILGIIAVAFLSGLSTSLKAVLISDERSTAQALAQGQMEYVKSQDYDEITEPPQYSENPSLTPDGYTVDISAERLYPEGGSTDDDDGLQKITITIYHSEVVDEDEKVFTLEDYKVNR